MCSCRRIDEIRLCKLSWNSDQNEEIPVGAYIILDGEKYSLLDPYNPEQKNEVEFQYKPQFHSKFISWGKAPFSCILMMRITR